MMRKMTSLLICLVLVLMCFSACVQGKQEENTLPDEGSISIKLFFNKEELIVDLYENNSAKDFANKLPLTLMFDDYNWAEKTATLPGGDRLNTSGVASGHDPSVGELGYYAPWGNIVIYHGDFGYASGIVPLGKFRSGVQKFSAIDGEVAVRFERFGNE